MKLLKKSMLLSLVAPLLFSLLSFTNAMVGESDDLITVTIYQNCKNCKEDAKIVIVEGGKSKEVKLVHGLLSPEMNQNLEVISNLLNDYKKTGYKIEASNSSVNGYYQVTTYILTK